METTVNAPIAAIRARRPVFWANTGCRNPTQALPALELRKADIREAEARLSRFAPLLAERFPELKPDGGIIESPLLDAEALKPHLGTAALHAEATVLMKADHALPVAGSIKARGGIYAVLAHAEHVAVHAGRITVHDDYRRLLDHETRTLFAGHRISVGSTGNLGLSIGIMGAALGFRVTVHMSVEAKTWKKARLRAYGVEVVEHTGDYTSACAVARQQAAADDRTYFIDDEDSIPLLLGYGVAAVRLARQLEKEEIVVDDAHPIFLYLPCGVGGAPGGITFGARHVFGNHVHCFFAEPIEAPCVLLGLLTGKHEAVSVYDHGLRLCTDADGLAVSRPSGRVCRLMAPLLDGCYTVSDERLYHDMLALYDAIGIEVEPSAAAGCAGPGMLLDHDAGREFLDQHGMTDAAARGTHVIWTTGGSLVPQPIHQALRKKARTLQTLRKPVHTRFTAVHLPQTPQPGPRATAGT